MNPLAVIHYPTSTEADLDRLHTVAEQLAGFDDTLSLEWLDGAMTALAAGPRQRPLAEWRDRLLGDTWTRTFADPLADREASTAVQARWNVLLRQLDPEPLMEAPDDLRLAPVMLEWADDRGEAAEGGEQDANRDEAPQASATDDEDVWAYPRTGEVWAIGFMEVVATFVEDWPEDARAFGDQAEAFEGALARIALLGLAEERELEEAVRRMHPDREPTRDELIEDALYAVQDLRLFFVENAPRPETRRVGAQPGRNDPCPCGSGLKFKKCHGRT